MCHVMLNAEGKTMKTIRRLSAALLAGLAAAAVPFAAQSQAPKAPAGDGTYLPSFPPQFNGSIGLTARTSTPDFPQPVRAPKGAPNILLILTDDVGFSASSTFGGPVPTPTMDRLAKAGLRYTQFHTTALCSPTRAALLTGRNHHTNATGVVMELATGYPGYNSLMPKSSGTFAEVLRQSGYNTAWYGKNHNVPDWQSSQAGPFDLWPTALGFEYFYGFIGADANQWAPALFEGTKPIEPPHDKDYFFDRDMADHAIARLRLLNAMAPDKPWVTYYATGTAHAPHHAPKEWIAKFKGRFDQGWDKLREETFARQKQMGIIPPDTRLTARPKEIQAWDSLDADRKKVYAHMMEVFAAALSHADYQMGRILDAIEEQGDLDNTLIVYIQGDNGASAEGTPQGLLNEMTIANGIPEDFSEILRRMDELGGPLTYNHFPVGWAHATNTPLQWTKQIASYFGGTRNGLVISWPARIKDKGGIRTQFHHVIDVAPTILEAVGVPAPAMLDGVPQTPIEGVSMIYTFDDAKAPSRRRTQYFEMLGNRALYSDGWIASTIPPVAPWVVGGKKPDVLDYKWELYNVAQDFSQADNLAEKEPAKLRELQELFWIEAAKYNVLPLDNSTIERFDVRIRPSLTRGRNVFTYFPGQIRIPEGTAPDLKNKSFKVGASVDIPAGGADGVMATQGGRFNGWGLYLKDGVPVFHYNLVGVKRFSIAGKERLAPGKHLVLADFKYDGGGLGKGGTLTLSVDGKAVAEGRIDRTYAFRVSLDETFDIGEDTGTPVSEDYKVPFRFTGSLERVLVRLAETKLTAEDEAQIRRAGVAIDIWK